MYDGSFHVGDAVLKPSPAIRNFDVTMIGGLSMTTNSCNQNCGSLLKHCKNDKINSPLALKLTLPPRPCRKPDLLYGIDYWNAVL